MFLSSERHLTACFYFVGFNNWRWKWRNCLSVTHIFMPKLTSEYYCLYIKISIIENSTSFIHICQNYWGGLVRRSARFEHVYRAFLVWFGLQIVAMIASMQWYFTRDTCNRYADSYKIQFKSWSQTSSAIVTTIWRPGFKAWFPVGCKGIVKSRDSSRPWLIVQGRRKQFESGAATEDQYIGGGLGAL